MKNVGVGLCLCFMGLAGCGGSSGGGGGNPTQPSGSITSITVALRDVVLVGSTATATGTAALSNGGTQAITAGWRSDAPAVAAVTDAGVVSGVANGDATIFVISGGVQGSRRVRVAPSYDGRWSGMQQITSCTATGDFQGFCEEEGGFVGLRFPVGLTARHPGDLTVSGEFTIESLPFPTFTTSVEGDGTIRFSSVVFDGPVRGEASWVVNSTQNGRATGTIREVYNAPSIVAGEITFLSTLSSFDRTGADSALTAPDRSSRVGLMSRRLAGYR